MLNNVKDICIVGLGTIGSSTGKYLKKYYNVIGIDINSQKVEAASKLFPTYDEWADAPNSDAYIICVNTGLGNKPTVKPFEKVCKSIADKEGTQPLIAIESTLPYGASRKMCAEYDFTNLVNCPHRYWGVDEELYGVNQLRVIGGINEDSLQNGIEFYTKAEIPLHPVSSIEISELSKVVENSHRYVQIALVEELFMMCQENGINFEELREACNTKWNVGLLEPRNGIGGHCLPKDIKMLTEMRDSEFASIFREAQKIDKDYRLRLPK